MASISFEKLHGLGNDFVVLDGMRDDINLTPEQVIALCDRHFGIGADGVIVVKPSNRPECDGYMHYINSDGTLAQMCGNGVRCTAKFLVDHGYVDPSAGKLIVDTLSGPKPISFSVNGKNRLREATVQMGAPILEPARVPVAAEATAQTAEGVSFAADVPIESPWGTFNFTCVSMGNPHAVCVIDDWSALSDSCFPASSEKNLKNFKVSEIGAFFESHPLFPEKTNVEFVDVHDAGCLSMRVYERGCGETCACGTGACATVVAAYLTGRASAEADVELLGGTLHIWLEDGVVMMSGPAVKSFEGSVKIQEGTR